MAMPVSVRRSPRWRRRGLRVSRSSPPAGPLMFACRLGGMQPATPGLRREPDLNGRPPHGRAIGWAAERRAPTLATVPQARWPRLRGGDLTAHDHRSPAARSAGACGFPAGEDPHATDCRRAESSPQVADRAARKVGDDSRRDCQHCRNCWQSQQCWRIIECAAALRRGVEISRCTRVVMWARRSRYEISSTRTRSRSCSSYRQHLSQR